MPDPLLYEHIRLSISDLLDEAEAIVDRRLAEIAQKGDFEGHPFRGNQYTSGMGGSDTGLSGGDSGITQRMGIAESTARELGVNPDDIEYGGEGYAFSVGDDNFIAAGQFDPSTGKITLYKGALNASETELKGITAHEVQHAKFNTVMSEYHAEVQRIINDPGTIDKISPSGKVREQFKGEFPAYEAIDPYISQSRELAKKDGITSYSTSYWKAYFDGKVNFETAVNETLAEVAHQKAIGVKTGIPNVWRNFYNEINAQHKRIKPK